MGSGVLTHVLSSCLGNIIGLGLGYDTPFLDCRIHCSARRSWVGWQFHTVGTWLAVSYCLKVGVNTFDQDKLSFVNQHTITKRMPSPHRTPPDSLIVTGFPVMLRSCTRWGSCAKLTKARSIIALAH